MLHVTSSEVVIMSDISELDLNLAAFESACIHVTGINYKRQEHQSELIEILIWSKVILKTLDPKKAQEVWSFWISDISVTSPRSPLICMEGAWRP